MKKHDRLFLPIGFLLFFLLCLVPGSEAQSQLSFVAGEPFQAAITWPAVTAGTTSLAIGNVTGLQFFTVNWVVNGTASGCTFTLDGSTLPGASFSTGSIVGSQSCSSTGTYTTPTATENVRAQLSYTFSNTGSVTFTVRGYTENPATASGAAANVNVTSPVDGSGYVNVDCKTGCAGGNANGQATMANSAPVVVASNQSTLPVKGAGTAGTADANVVTVQGIASMTKLLVTPDSVALPANQSVNVNQVGGASTGATNPLYEALTDGTTGPVAVKAASTAAAAADKSIVVQISPNQPNTTAALNVALAANQSVNVAQIGGSSPVTGTGAGGAGIPRVTVSNDSSLAANQSVNVNQVGGASTGATNPLYEALTDGTNGPVAVKAASTAAAAADKSIVVQISPNQPNTTAALNVALAANQSVNVAQIGGSSAATAASGVQKVGVVGNTGASLDSTVAAGSAPTNGVAILGQYNASQPAPTTAQTVAEQLDQAGNQLNFPGIQFKTGAAWTSATGAGTFQYPTGTTTQGQLAGAPAVLAQLDQTSTVTGGVVTWQGTYDNVNWVTIPVAQVLNPNTLAQLTNPYTLVATTNQPFLILTQGFVNVRADLSTAITGTATVTPYWATLPASPLSNLPATAMAGTVPGTAPNYTDVIGGMYNSAAPGPSTGQTLPLQQDNAGNLYTAFRSTTNGCSSNNGALNSVALNASTTSLTQIVALSAGKKIYICAAYIQGGGTTPTLSLEYGTGTNCATGTTVLTQAVALTTAAPGISWPGPGPVVPSANALCYVLTGTSPTAVGWISYVQ